MYQSDKQEKKFDILIYQFQNLLKRFDNDWEKQQFQTLLQDHQLDENLKKILNVIFCSQSSFSFSISNNSSEWDQNSEKQQNDSESDNKFDDVSIDRFNSRTNNETNVKIFNKTDNEINAEMSEKVLKQLIKNKYKKNEIMQNIMTAKLKKLQRLSQHIMIKEIKLAMRNLEIWNNQFWISS